MIFFLREPATILRNPELQPFLEFNNLSPFLGVISNVGILLWCISVSIYLFTFLLLTTKSKQKLKNNLLFLLSLGLFSFLLLFDDLFLVHEFLASRLLSIEEEMVYCCYAAITIYLMIKFRKTFLNSDIIVLCIALLFFALSLAVDVFHFASYFVEDGFKLLGIGTWAFYSVIICFQLLQSVKNKNGNY